MNPSPLRFFVALLISAIGLTSTSSAQLAFQFNFTDSGSGFNDPTLGAFALPAGSLDAGLLVNLAPGAYTVQLSGTSNGTGVGLIEVYDAD